ncbi:DNA gyrase C-terminal beta-propeller domain-containing protein [Micromonospora sp. DH15]|nr:DNA gyrase C-terminal beta-propeller domain-containing protein [Micromonospora sp. DH15]
MTDTPESTPSEPEVPETPAAAVVAHDRIEPVGLEVEMQRSYLDYAMSVIVGRALPDVRDGLKPVHRKILYAMFDSGYRPDRGYVKCSRVVGDVMGQFHPHGDSAIYDALVRMAQPWSLRYPLVDGNGNFGSPGNDPAAAMRYCLDGNVRIRTADGAVRIGDVVSDAAPSSETDIELKVRDRNGDLVRASKFFHSGEHPTLRLRTREGYELTGTHNHPVLCLVDVAGVPTLLWKLLAEIGPGDRVVIQRTVPEEIGYPMLEHVEAAVLAGAFVSEGWVSKGRAGFNNTDREFFVRVLAAYDLAVGGPRYVSQRTIASGSVLHEIDVQDLSALRESILGELVGARSAAKFVPEFVWRGPAAIKRAFLQALFEGDGSSSLLPRNTIQISYSTRSERLAREVQQLLLEFGVISRQCPYDNGEIKVVLNNLYKHTQLQETFGANMLALVDGVPRTLNLAQFIRYYVEHQIEVIRRRTAFRLRKAEERAHILRGLSKALDALDEVIALIRRSPTVEDARQGLIRLLEIDEIQATAILDMQLRRLAALERQRILDDLAKLELEIADLKDILAKPERQRRIVSEELGEIIAKWGDERRTKIVPFDGEVSMEDLIAREDVVVTITRTGYAKRTKVDLYRSQRRGGKGVSGATLRQDDIVSHFFVCSTHDWILFFTNKGRVYRAKAYELPEASRVAKGQHVANLLAFQADEQIAQIIEIPNYQVAPYLVLATKNGLVKKTRLEEFDSNRSGGVIAINLRDEDELVGAALVAPSDDLLLVSKNAQAIRFNATDEALRPMGRATSGVIGMRFSDEDVLLAMEVVREGLDVLVATNGGYAKRTPIEEYPVQGRGGKGVLTAKITERRGGLVGAVVIHPDDELFAITSNGGVIRTPVKPVRRTRDRNTMGVKLMDLPDGVTIVAIARNADEPDEQD